MTSFCRRTGGIKLGLACARDFILGASKINCKSVLTTTLGRDCVKSLSFFLNPGEVNSQRGASVTLCHGQEM